MRFRRIFLVLAAVCGLYTSVLAVTHLTAAPQKHEVTQVYDKKRVAHIVAKPLPKMSLDPAPPTKLAIGSIGLQADISPVGRDANGNMDDPSSSGQAVWYQYGYLPGALGSSVIAGHYVYHSKPALFYALKDVKIGDSVTITNEHNHVLEFKVVASTSLAATAPTDELFGKSDKALLRLITCHGTWDKAAQQYTERLVVTTEFVREDLGR